MNSFTQKYTVVQVISSKATKKTSIVKDSMGKYYISKKLFINDEQALKQIQLIKHIKHPNIVQFHQLVVQKNYIYLIQEFCQQGDIGFHIRRQIRKKKTYFQQQLIAQWTLQILLALQYLQNQKIMHRDIRPQNIFLTSKGNIKLGSFRSSKIFQGQTDLAITVLGSPYYMAPEFVQKQVYDFKVDIWALGCVLFQLCALRPIYNTKNMVQLAHKIMKGRIQELPSRFSKQLNIILNRCLKKSIQRPSARQLLRTDYFLQVMKKFVFKKGFPLENRIPIKRYKIHNKRLQTAKIKKGINRHPQKKKKQEQFSFQFPRLQIQTARNTRKSLHSRGKQQQQNVRCPNEAMTIKVYKSVQKIRKMSQQRIFNSKQKKNQFKIQKKLVPNKTLYVENGIKYSPNIKKKQVKLKQIQKKSIQKQIRSQNEQKKKEIVKEEKEIKQVKQVKQIQQVKEIKQSKKKMLPPPMLPRPNYKNPQKKIDLSNTMKKKDLQQELSQVKLKQPYKQQYKKNDQTASVKQSLAKLFEDLNIRQDDQQEFSFDLEEQDMARLTFQQKQNTQFLKTYKTKLQQMIEEINYKYCPNMQPIQQRTNQFDSNTFAQFHV